jgi:hypothetical protein
MPDTGQKVIYRSGSSQGKTKARISDKLQESFVLDLNPNRWPVPLRIAP